MKTCSTCFGRDVSTKRPQTRRGRVPIEVSKVEGRKSKVAGLWALVFVAFLAPLMASADIVRSPNDYEAFLHHAGNGTFASCALSGALLAILIAMPVIFCLVFRAVNNRFSKKPIVYMENVVLALLGLSLSLVVAMFFGNDFNACLSRFRDSPELRAKYDRKCIEYYDSYKASTNWPKIIMHQLGKDAPIMRPDAPEAVTNAYLRYRRELAKTVFVP